MEHATLEYTIFLIFAGAALMATLSLFARQALLVGHIILGILFGPWGLGFITDPVLIQDISNIGIIFLLYLLGLDLLPQQLMSMLKNALFVTLASSFLFLLIGFCIGYFFGYEVLNAIIIGSVVMFSSTIIGLKLLPTTILHHKHTGQIIISILLIQDLIAIIILLIIQGYGKGDSLLMDIAIQLISLPVFILIAYLMSKYLLIKLITRFDRIHEYIFLLAIAWCLGMSELAKFMGLSGEIGAFIAGVTLASSPIAFFITEHLKPLRDFFLILFFFSLGASFDLSIVNQIIFPALLLAILVLIFKPLVFTVLLKLIGEKQSVSVEVGFRLGQISEFSLLIAVLALESGLILQSTSYLIQLTTLLTFIVSSYLIVLRYPTPIAVNDRLRRD